MPNIKGAIKRVKQIEKRRLQNASQKSALRTAIKNVTVAVEAQDKEKAAEAYKLAIKKLDKAANKGLLHPNKVNRQKSQLSKQVSELSAQ